MKGGIVMATDSITHNFYFEGESAERFVYALAEALDGPGIAEALSDVHVNVTELHGEELWAFMEKARKANVKR